MNLTKKQLRNLKRGEYAGQEDDLQVSCVEYFNLQYPGVRIIHIANERKCSPQFGALLKKMGVSKGVVDLFIPAWLTWIEIKVPPNKPTEKQFEFMGDMEELGFRTFTAYSFGEFKQIVDITNRDLKGKKIAIVEQH